MRLMFFAAAAAFSALALSPALAATAEPDDFASGSDISNAFAGVTLLTVRTGANVNDVTATGPVFSLTDGNTTTGTRAFAQTSTDSTWGAGNFEYLLATFTTPVTSVSLDFFANDGLGDRNAQLLAFDAMGAQLDVDGGDAGFAIPITLTVTGAGIKFIRAYWDETTRAENGGLDNLVFSTTAIPEPATWAMMIGGFGLAGAAMRRARPHVATA